MKRDHDTEPLVLAICASSILARIAATVLTGVAAAFLLVPSCLAQTSSASPHQGGLAGGAGGELQLAAGLEHGVVLRGAPGEAYLVIDLTAAEAARQTRRPAMSIALVVDRSGSMSGEKMAQAIAAASSFIQNLANGDVVSIFQYDDVVEQLAPPTTVTPTTRPALLASLSGMYPRGSTNLHGGLVAGIASLTGPAAERPIRRVVLISDGLANVGPSSPVELGALSASAAATGISVTSIGVGLDYDETLLGTLAVRSGGRFYHLEEPAQMIAILSAELNALTRTVARNVVLEVSPAQGVQFLGATGADILDQRGPIQLRVGEVLGGTSRPVVVALRLPSLSGGEAQAASIGLQYVSADSGVTRTLRSLVGYRLGSAREAEASLDPRFALAVEQHRAAEANQRAAEMMRQGQGEQAANLLAQQATRTEGRAAALPRTQRTQLMEQARRMRTSSSTAREARSPAARRAASLRMSDEALDGLGF